MNIIINLILLLTSIMILLNSSYQIIAIELSEISELSYLLSILLGVSGLVFLQKQILWQGLMTGTIFLQCLGGAWMILTGSMSNIYLLIPLLIFLTVLYGVFNLQKTTHNGEL